MSDLFPREFLCEHTPSKSRVHAVLVTHRDGVASIQLKAVLTCADPGVAEDAAAVLTATARNGRDPDLEARAEQDLRGNAQDIRVGVE